jgi:hypothetical protein
MQHWTKVSRRYAFVAAVSVLVVGALTPENGAERQAINHWGGTSGKFHAVAGFDWGRAVADYGWDRAMAGFDWNRAVASWDWSFRLR